MGLLITLITTPAAIVCPLDLSMNLPNSLHSAYNSKHTGRDNSTWTTAVEFLVMHLNISISHHT